MTTSPLKGIWDAISKAVNNIRNRRLPAIKLQTATGIIKNAKQNLSLVLHGVNDLRLENRPVPEPKDNEVLLRMSWAGICGSDIHSYTANQQGKKYAKNPIVLGHEASGIVVKVGTSVKHLQCGDKVAIEPGVPCGKCDYCKQGRYNLCENLILCSVPPHDGTICQYHVHPANYCFKLPEGMCLEDGALMEPISVAVYSCQRGNIGFGDQVLIIGCGTLGLLTLIVAKHMGAFRVVVTDLKDYRLDLAKTMGADCSLNVGNCEGNLGNIVKEIKKHFGNNSPDKTIDCVGSEATVTISAMATKSGGAIVLARYNQNEMKLPLMDFVLLREIDIKGVFRCCNTFKTAMNIASSFSVDPKKIITHKFKLENAIEAFDTAKTGCGNPVKILIHCNCPC